MFKRLSRFFITREAVETKVLEVVKRYSSKPINMNSNYEELDMDDSDILEVIAVVECDLEANLNENEVMAVRNIPETVELFFTSINSPKISKSPSLLDDLTSKNQENL